MIEVRPPILGAPYRLGGRTPAGWDCWGCVVYLRREWFGRETPGWAEPYSFRVATSPDAVADLIRSRLAQWRPVAPAPGAVALLKWEGRPAHVGLMISDRTFVHAFGGAETSTAEIDGPLWRDQFLGCFDAD